MVDWNTAGMFMITCAILRECLRAGVFNILITILTNTCNKFCQVTSTYIAKGKAFFFILSYNACMWVIQENYDISLNKAYL